MSSPSPISDRQRGQVLPLGLVAVLVLVAMLAFSLRLSSRLIQRERTRMRTDVTAYSGGIQYARSMNLLAASEQAVAGGWVATVVTFGGYYSVQQQVQRIQGYCLKAGPWLVEASTVGLGMANGLLAVPAWNKKTLFEKPLEGSFTPSFNVAVRDAMGVVTDAVTGVVKAVGLQLSRGEVEKELKAQLAAAEKDMGQQGVENFKRGMHELLPEMDQEVFTRTKGYHYTKKNGTRVDLPTDAAGPRQESDGKGGTRTVHKTNNGDRYVAADKGVNEQLAMDLAETGDHYLTLLSVQMPGESPEAPRPGWCFNVAQVRIDGGNMEMGDREALCWRPRLVPVRLMPPFSYGEGDQKTEMEWDELVLTVLDAAEGMGVSSDNPWMRRLRRGLSLGQDVMAVQH